MPIDQLMREKRQPRHMLGILIVFFVRLVGELDKKPRDLGLIIVLGGICEERVVKNTMIMRGGRV
jgi:hypothetical protein